MRRSGAFHDARRDESRSPVTEPVRSAIPVGAFIGLLTADLVYGFQQTAITPALPAVQAAFGASREWTMWLFTGYLVVAGVAPVFLGKVADRVGKRQILLLALSVFFVGSVGSALSPSIEAVVVFRLIQGVGGVVLPLSFAIVGGAESRDRVNRAIGLLTGGFSFGAVIGLPLGGAIAQAMSWRWIFGIGAMALALAITLVWRTVPRLPGGGRHGLDTPGALLLAGAIAALIVAITEGPQRGWTSTVALAMFAVSVALFAVWYVRETHTPEPLMDLRVLGSRRVLFTNIAALLGGYAAFGVNLVMPFLLISGTEAARFAVLGLPAGPLLTGIVLLPRALGQTAGGLITNRIAAALGRRYAYGGALLLLGIAAATLAFWRANMWAVLLELAVVGVGSGLTISLSGSIIVSAAAPGQTGIATSITSVLRRIGGSLGAQVSVALLAAITLADGNTPAPRAFTLAFAACAIAAVAGAAAALPATTSRKST